MRKLLFVGDAACDSGFARATHAYADYLDYRANPGGQWDVTIIGLNYRGDPDVRKKYPYDIYPAYVPGGDLFGVQRLVSVLDKVRPDVVVFQNDPWNIPRYMERADAVNYLQAEVDFGWRRPAYVGAIAVDGLNCRGTDMNKLDHVIFWTKFAEVEARKGGFTKSSGIVPLGVDLNIYNPGDRLAARRALEIPPTYDNSFIFLNVNRNQPRKRLDLTLQYFAEWYHSFETKPDAALYLHVCPTGDVGIDCDQLAKYYGLKGRVLLAQPGVYQGFSEGMVAQTYRAANALLSTTLGEGWGLTTMEAMACGIPCVVPDWAALGEWAWAATLIPCTSYSVTPNKVNVIGGVPDRAQTIKAMHTLYSRDASRAEHTRQGMILVHQPEYRWKHVAEAFGQELEKVAARRAV
jgi:D-inositol-3-phosphate glycosyltransferase